MKSAYLDCQDSDGFGHERGGGPGPFADVQAFCPRHLVVEGLGKKHPVRLLYRIGKPRVGKPHRLVNLLNYIDQHSETLGSSTTV